MQQRRIASRVNNRLTESVSVRFLSTRWCWRKRLPRESNSALHVSLPGGREFAVGSYSSFQSAVPVAEHPLPLERRNAGYLCITRGIIITPRDDLHSP